MEIAFWVYLLITAVAVMLTLNEGEHAGRPWGFFRVAGVALTVFWPIAVLLAGWELLKSRRERRNNYDN